MREKKKGLLEMLFATLIWGSIPVFSVWCVLPSPIFIFFRVLLAFPFVFLYSVKNLGVKEFFRFRPFTPLLLSGTALSLNWILFFWAIQLTNVASAVILYYLGPIFTIILAVFFLKESFGKTLFWAIVLAFSGSVLTFIPNLGVGHHRSFFGLAIAFLSGVFYGLLGFISKISVKYHSAIKLTTYQIFISIFLTMPFVLFVHFKLTPFIVTLLVITGVVHTALALFLWYDSLNHIKVTVASIFSFLDPFFAIIMGFLFLRQIPTLFQILGGTLIIISGIMASLGENAAS